MSTRSAPKPSSARAGGSAAGVGAVVVLATAPGDGDGPAAGLPWEGTTVLRRLLDQLAALGAPGLHVVTRPRWAAAIGTALHGLGTPVQVVESDGPGEDLQRIAHVAAATHGAVVICQGDLVTQREALAGLLADPRVATGVLATGGRVGRPFAFKLHARRGRLLSAASPYHTVHRPNCAFLGVLKVADADRERLIAVAERLSEPADDPPAAWREELEIKAGTWRLAWARILARRAAREAAGLSAEPSDAEVARDEREADVRTEVDLAADDGADAFADGEPSGRLQPDDVELAPEDLAELERRRRAAPDDVAALLVTGLVRDGAAVGLSHLRGLYWSRPLSAEGIARSRERIADFDEDAALRASAVKASDGFFTTFLVSPYSQYIARWCAERGFTPNQITVASLGVGAAAAASFATGRRDGRLAGAVLLQAAFTLDCVDGQTARYTRTFSKLGAWLDSVFDRSKEYLVFAGLATGASRRGTPAWGLACAALTLQTARHAIDFSFPATQHQAIAARVQPPLGQPWDGEGQPQPAWKRSPAERASAEAARARAAANPPPPPGPVLRAKRWWRRTGRDPRVRWGKKVLMFPIGERFAAISATAAVRRPEATFVVLLTWGGIAGAYIVAGRSLHAIRRATAAGAGPIAQDSEGARRLAAYRDDGALGQLLVRAVGDGHASPLRWLIPPGLRVAEFAGVTALAASAGPEALPAAYALLCASAFHHYDVVYRLRQRDEEPPTWLTAVGLGWDGRLLAVAALVALDLAPEGLWVLAAALGGLYATEAAASWAAFGRTQIASSYADEEEDEE